MREGKVKASDFETQRIKAKPMDELKVKEFLSVRDVATLLNCSRRSVYYYIESGNLKAVNLSQRITRIRRTDIDKLFEKQQPPPPTSKQETINFDVTDCYNFSEVQIKYGISETALQNLIKRNSIPKIKKGWFAYVPKTVIDKLLS